MGLFDSIGKFASGLNPVNFLKDVTSRISGTTDKVLQSGVNTLLDVSSSVERAATGRNNLTGNIYSSLGQRTSPDSYQFELTPQGAEKLNLPYREPLTDMSIPGSSVSYDSSIYTPNMSKVSSTPRGQLAQQSYNTTGSVAGANIFQQPSRSTPQPTPTPTPPPAPDVPEVVGPGENAEIIDGRIYYKANPQAFGISGTSGSGSFSSSFVPQTGTSGLGAFSNKTGLSGGANFGMTFPISSQSTVQTQDDTEEQKRQNQQQAQGGGAFPIVPATGQAGMMGAIPGTGQQTSVQSLSQYAQGKIGDQTITPGASTQRTDRIIDKDNQIDLDRQISSLRQGNVNIQDPSVRQAFEDIVNQADQIVQNFKQVKMSSVPETPVPTVDFIANNQQEADMVSQMNTIVDQISQGLGMPQTIRRVEELQAELDGTQQAYRQIIDDIDANPNLPTSLARRRMNAVAQEADRRINQLQSQLGIATNQLNLQREELRFRIGLAQDQMNAQRQLQQQEISNARDLLNTYINTGAIANFTDQQIQQLAQASGATPDSLLRVREAINSQNMQAAQEAAAEAQQQAFDNQLALQREGRLSAESQPGAGFSQAQSIVDQIVQNNPTATNNQLKLALQQNTNLNQSEINSILDNRRFISADWFKSVYTPEQLEKMVEKAAEEDGYTGNYITRTGFLGLGGKKIDVDSYLKDLEQSVEIYRQQGYTDEQILKQMQS